MPIRVLPNLRPAALDGSEGLAAAALPCRRAAAISPRRRSQQTWRRSVARTLAAALLGAALASLLAPDAAGPFAARSWVSLPARTARAPLAAGLPSSGVRRQQAAAGLTQRRFFQSLFGEEKKEEKQPQAAPQAPPAVTEEVDKGNVLILHSEEEINDLVAKGEDVVVKLAFTWCRPCKAFWPKYVKYADVYSKTRFVKIVGNENASCKHYAREVLKAKISPLFAVYSKGALVSSWHGANNGRFIRNMEEFLPSAKERAAEREDAVAADSSLAPT